MNMDESDFFDCCDHDIRKGIYCVECELSALRAERDDLAAREAVLLEALCFIDESFNTRHRSQAEHMLVVAHKAHAVLSSLNTLGVDKRVVKRRGRNEKTTGKYQD